MSKFKVGDKAIVVVSELASGYRDGHGAEYDPGKVVTIVEEVDDEGDCCVKSDESAWNCYIAEKNLKPLEESARATVGTVTVDVQVRFMIGDVDVTDKLKGLVAAEVAA